MIVRRCLTVLLFLPTSCMYDKHELFQYYVQGTIGETIELWGVKIGKGGYGPPGLLEVQVVGTDTLKYIYGKGKLCQWFFLVEKSTGVIRSWGYIGAPEHCKLVSGSPK